MLNCANGHQKEFQEEFDQVEESCQKKANTAEDGQTPEEVGEEETCPEEGAEEEGLE